MSEILEVCVDASLKKFGTRTFTCSGAVCINTMEEKYVVTNDSTNNRGELLAVYLGIKLAEATVLANPGVYSGINLYSDSQLAIYGLREWMPTWVKNMDRRGILHGSDKKPVKNQELFLMIVTYCVTHNLVVHFYLQKGHMNMNSQADLADANLRFKNANGFFLRPEDIFKITFYNDLVDKNSRRILDTINPDEYEHRFYSHNTIDMCRYIVPPNYRDYIC